MKKVFSLLGIITVLSVIVFSMVACGDGADGSNKTKFEGSWYDRDPFSPMSDYDVLKFTGNDFVHQTFANGQYVAGQQVLAGTFTYTDTEITWIAPTGATWGTFTSRYSLNGNRLLLREGTFHGKDQPIYTKE